MNISSINVYDAQSVHDVLNLLEKEPGKWSILAGGTDLMVQMDLGTLQSQNLINVWGLPELAGITVRKDEVEINALTTFSEIKNHPIIKKEFPMLIEAAHLTGSIAIQNRGTIGGNIMNASPAADTPPALLAYGAEIELTSKNEVRRLFYKDFHINYKVMRINPDEMLTKIILRRTSEKTIDFYQKVGTRAAHSISKACVAIRLKLDKKIIKDIKIGLGAVAPMPMRVYLTEELLKGNKLSMDLIDEAILQFAKEIHPIDDIRSNKAYRLRVAINLLRNFLKGHIS